LILALSACGKGGPGVSAESSAGTDAGQKRTAEKTKGVEKKLDAKATVTAPASLIIADAMAEMIAKPIEPDRTRWLAAAGRKEFSILAGASTDEARRTLAAAAIVAAHAARAGWEVEPEGKQAKAYFLANASLAEFASVLEAEIARSLGNQLLADPDAARDAVRAALAALPPQVIQAAALEAVATAKKELAQGVIPDLASGHGVAFTAGRTQYSGGPDGWEIKRGGSVWFGGGVCQGQHFELALESSTSKTVGKTKKVEIHEGDKQDTTDKATAEVK
jgi:hypothetical protein